MTAGLPRSDSSDALLYIINLSSSAAPMALEAPDAPELAGYAVFRSRRVEDGRDRYRLHLGYFDSQELAESVLPVVRAKYPAAWVALAPRDSMGSLDDTSVAQFKFIRQTTMSRAPASNKGPAAVVTPMLRSEAPRPHEPAALPPIAPTVAKAPEARVEPAVLEPAEILTLLESPPRILEPAVPAEPAIDANQRFAVQLVWSAERVDTAKIAQLGIFDAYTLYTVQVQRAGRRWYGLRLGFFSDPISARQVSLYARSDFSAAAVVPVSERECDRAAGAALASLKKTAQKVAPAVEDAAHRSAGTAAKEPTLLSDRPRPAPKVAQKPAGKSGKTGKRSRTAEELLQELGANEVSFQQEGADALNDTGVRHLSISVVKRARVPGKRSSMFGR